MKLDLTLSTDEAIALRRLAGDLGTEELPDAAQRRTTRRCPMILRPEGTRDLRMRAGGCKMTTFTDELIAASDDLDSLSEYELAALLRRAALRLDLATREDHKVTIQPAIMSIVQKLSDGAGITPGAAVNAILRDWLIGSGDMPVKLIDEDTETKGSA
jgi:hypothetical protein